MREEKVMVDRGGVYTLRDTTKTMRTFGDQPGYKNGGERVE